MSTIDMSKEATARSAMKLALEALVAMSPSGPTGSLIWHQQMCAITAIREALALVNEVDQEQPAQPQQEPVKVGRITDNIKGMVLRQEVMLYTDDYLPIGAALYTSPPTLSLAQRQARSADTWVGLTDEEQQAAYDAWQQKDDGWGSFYALIEAKLKEKNSD